MARLWFLIALAIGNAFFMAFELFAFTVPPLHSPVNDTADILSESTEQNLNAELKRLWDSGGSQIAVLTLKDLDGLEIEEAGIKIADEWKLGTAKDDNGVILIISVAERKMRIEVGQGREGELPDAYAKRILDKDIAPRMRQGDIDGAIVAGVMAIAARTDPQFSFGMQGPRRVRMSHRANLGDVITWIFYIFFMALFIAPRFFRQYRRGINTYGYSSWGGGGRSSGWGSGSGGGFSGGGGGFSGGGASSGW